MTARCNVCGEPMLEGEEMFMFHGYSGPCPKPPLPQCLASYAGAQCERRQGHDGAHNAKVTWRDVDGEPSHD